MTFKLSAQTKDVADPRLARQLYTSYVEENKWRIPESALEVIGNPEWDSGSESESPHDSRLVSLQITGIGLPSSRLSMVLMKERYSEPHYYLELSYKGLFALDIPNEQPISLNPLVWNCDEFLYFDACTGWEIKDKHFVHHIEWVGTSIWSITAREISARWKFFEHHIGEDLVEAEGRVRPIIRTIGETRSRA